MENNYKILDLFPIPLYLGKLPSNISSVVSFLDSQKLNEAPDHISNMYGYRSKNTYILNELSCQSLSTYILKEATTYCKDVLNYNYEEYIFSQSWISHKHPGQQHTIHTHSNSLISGVLYYGGTPQDESPQIDFHNKFILDSPTRPQYSPPLNQYSSSNFSLIPHPGMLILFPSSLLHSVPENTTNKIRKSLAFNIVPKEGLGAEDDLTQLKFN